MHKYYFITFASGETTAVIRIEVISAPSRAEGVRPRTEMLDTETGTFVPVDKLGTHTAVEITHRRLQF